MDKNNKTPDSTQAVEFPSGFYKVERCGNTTFCTSTHIGKTNIQVLPNREYVNLKTGEVLPMKPKAETRGDNLRTLKNSLAVLSKLIDFNIPLFASCVCVTFTYAENMTDTKRLYKDWVNFWKRLVYRYGEKKVSEYVIATEPQGRGAWHIHAIIFQRVKAFLPCKELAEIWGFGSIDVDKRKDDLDSLGKYLTAYLSDLRLDDLQKLSPQEFGAFMKKQQEKAFEVSKKFVYKDRQEHQMIKGARMLLYPANFHFFRWSKGIQKPTEERANLSLSSVKEYGSCVSSRSWEVDIGADKKMVVKRFIFKRSVNKDFKKEITLK